MLKSSLGHGCIHNGLSLTRLSSIKNLIRSCALGTTKFNLRREALQEDGKLESGLAKNIDLSYTKMHIHISNRWHKRECVGYPPDEIDLNARQLVQEYLNITNRSLVAILSRTEFHKCSKSQIVDTALRLKNLGIKKEHILAGPWLLSQQVDIIEQKLELIANENMFKNDLDGIGFTLYPDILISKYAKKFRQEKDSFPNSKNRIYYISEQLQLPVDLLTIKAAYAWNLLHLSKEKIDEVIEVLLENEVTADIIVKDVWIFLHNLNTIKSRFQAMKSEGLKAPNLWACRCKPETFKRYLDRYAQKVRGQPIIDFLCEIFECDEEYIHAKNILKCNVSISRLKKNINMLTLGGLGIDQIRKCPSIISYDPERSRIRLHKLRSLGVPNIRLSLLTISDKKFDHYCRQVESDNPGTLWKNGR